MKQNTQNTPQSYGPEDYEIDNRDTVETELILPDGTTVEVLPWDLVRNILENADREDLIKKLNKLESSLED